MLFRISCHNCKTIVPVKLEYKSQHTYATYETDDWGNNNSTHEISYKVFFVVEECKICNRPLIAVGVSCDEWGCEETTLFLNQVWPIASEKVELPKGLPPHIAQDLVEAVQVLPYSNRAAAALARKAIHGILVDKANGDGSSLADDITTALKTDLFVGRQIGLLEGVQKCATYAIHANWNKETNEIIEISPEEGNLMVEIAVEIAHHIYEAIPRQNKILKQVGTKHRKKVSNPSKQASHNEEDSSDGKVEGEHLV